MMETIPNLSALLAGLKAASAEESAAKQRRIDIEARIAGLYKSQLPPNGGSKTFRHEGLRFEVTQDYNFKADFDGLEKLPAEVVAQLVRNKKEFVASAYKKLWDFNVEAAKAAAAFVTATPGKPSVKIKEGE